MNNHTPFWKKLIHNHQYRNNLMLREKILDSTRNFFKSNGFHELNTPVMVSNPGTEPYLEVFETIRLLPDGETERRFLTTSPELSLKKALVGGIGSCFEITKSFRNNEGLSSAHLNEFTILEWYRTPGNYESIMLDFEQWLLTVGRSIWGSEWDETINYQGKKYSLSTPWQRLTISEAFLLYAKVDVDLLLDEVGLPKFVLQKGLSSAEKITWEEAFHLLLLNLIEPHLGQTAPTILYDYPVALAALSKKKSSDPRFSERFEVYLGGLELGNAFSELLDVDEQQSRLQAEVALRKTLGKVVYEYDHDFIEALKHGMPETGGIAVGLDRIVMIFANATQIQDVTLV